jgi:Rap1a immunity proteins
MRVSMILLCFCGFLADCMLSNAYAEMDVSSFFQKWDKGKPIEKSQLELFVNGIYNGLSWTNAFLISMQKRVPTDYPQPVYCPPTSTAPTTSEIIDALRDFAKTNPELRQFPLGLGIVEAMRAKYPCRKT